KDLSEILYIFRRRFPRREYKKRQEPRDRRSQDYHSDRNDLLCQCHCTSPPLSSGLLSRVSTAVMASIAGMIKLSAPNAVRQSREIPSPSSELVCFFSFSHCSRKITTNMAVITNSSPSVSKWISDPKTPPSVAPENQ